jgi:two-component system nitrogen regulation response regulator NtrX
MMNNPVVMAGVSSAIRAVEEDIQHASRSDAKVLITGESGVGKEIVARLIHQRSRRAAGPLVTINCAGFPDSLLETEMFGHVKGSFTDAYRDKRGWLELANGGTIFMDEVGEMSLRMQALLLRFLESGEIQRVGSERRLSAVNVRVITATHRRLMERIAEKSFREDLYYRLNVIHVEVPPLRERVEDISVLMRFFLREFSSLHKSAEPELTTEALESLVAYPWPGNVRELKNVAERLILRDRSGRIGVESLPHEVLASRRRTGAAPAAIQPASSVGEALYDRIMKGRESFWSVVHEPFLSRDITRADLREVVRLGLEQTRGNYKLLTTTFNMMPEDYKRFISFLRKYQCHLPFRQFRVIRAVSPIPAETEHAASVS